MTYIYKRNGAIPPDEYEYEYRSSLRFMDLDTWLKWMVKLGLMGHDCKASGKSCHFKTADAKGVQT